VTGPLWSWSLKAVRDAIASREVSPVDAVEAVLGRIESRGRINAYVTVLGEIALSEARRREHEVAQRQPLGTLHGVPIALKDNVATAGTITTAGSPLREHWVPDEDATVVRSLREAGAILIGKNQLFEFAFGAAHPKFGETLNPWNLELTCGGSSSGSAAAVADGQAYGAVGTDTGGSIRIPAAMCGIVGLKPTNGRISTRGVIPVSTGLDVVGPMTRSVEDAELMLRGMGASAKEPATAEAIAPASVTIGILASQPGTEVVPEVADALETARKRLADQNFRMEEMALPDLSLVRDVMWTIASAEAAAYHRQELRDRPNEYCQEVRFNLMTGAMIPAVDYILAQRLRRRIADELAATFRLIDVLLLPSLPIAPYRSGQQKVTLGSTEVSVVQLIMGFTPLANLTGQPAITVPVTRTHDAPPITVQLYGRHSQERFLFRVAQVIERAEVLFPD
jgi:aspartyl-tRNA(Asn)/glutamyl-tRNA(Gln) amidotransferase subunit A